MNRKKITNIWCLCLALLVVNILAFKVKSQTVHTTAVEFKENEITVSKISSEGTIKDVTEQVNKVCNKEFRFTEGSVSVVVKFNSENELAIRAFADSVSRMLKFTRDLLKPIQTPEIIIYLFKTKNIPSNYKYISRKNIYPVVLMYSNSEQLGLTCNEYSAICEEIFATTPHELSHISISSLIETSDNTRWFDEGLAKYVESTVSGRFAEAVNRRDLFNTFPEAALHRSATRERLWDWKDANLDEVKNMDGWKVRWNTMALYGASHQLLRLINENARETENIPPVNYLLKQMKSAAGEKPLSSTEIEKLIEQHLELKVRDLGILSPEQKKELAGKAINFLTGPYSNNADRRPEKFWALSVIVSIDEKLSDADLRLLAAVLLDEKQDAVFRHLAATALVNTSTEIKDNKTKAQEIYKRSGIKELSVEQFEKILYQYSFTK